MNEVVIDICRRVAAAGGRAFVVGGAVRDMQIYKGFDNCKDFDIEVFNLPEQELEVVLKAKYHVDAVGKSFGIVKIKDHDIDVALPRREVKTGHGHKDFDVWIDPFMPMLEAAERRDFTINALSYDPLTGVIYDPMKKGLQDIEDRVLRHTSPQFSEDPLRVLRGMQFVARFGLVAEPETIALCSKLVQDHLPPERLVVEWDKLILKGKNIGAGVEFLRNTGWLDKYYPELGNLFGVPQDPVWHPEGDAYTHTQHCANFYAGARDAILPEDRLVVGYAVLLHDVGKAVTTEQVDGRWHAHGHEMAGVPIAKSFMDKLVPGRSDYVNEITSLVGAHMQPDQLFDNYREGRLDNPQRSVRRLANRVGNLKRLCNVVLCDKGGRPPKPATFTTQDWLMGIAKELDIIDSKPKPIVLGRHIVEMGLQPGPKIGEIQKACFEAQLDGVFTDLSGGIVYARKLVETPQ